MYGVTHRGEFGVNSHNHSYGIGTYQGDYYPYNGRMYPYHDEMDEIQQFVQTKFEIDILLDADNGKLNICAVGHCIKTKEARLWKLPTDNDDGWLPIFIVWRKNVEMRIAKIPTEYYGKQLKIFD